MDTDCIVLSYMRKKGRKTLYDIKSYILMLCINLMEEVTI